MTEAESVTMQLLDAWNARDLSSYVGLMTEDVEWYDPAMSQPPARGRVGPSPISRLRPLRIAEIRAYSRP